MTATAWQGHQASALKWIVSPIAPLAEQLKVLMQHKPLHTHTHITNGTLKPTLQHPACRRQPHVAENTTPH